MNSIKLIECKKSVLDKSFSVPLPSKKQEVRNERIKEQERIAREADNLKRSRLIYVIGAVLQVISLILCFIFIDPMWLYAVIAWIGAGMFCYGGYKAPDDFEIVFIIGALLCWIPFMVTFAG